MGNDCCQDLRMHPVTPLRSIATCSRSSMHSSATSTVTARSQMRTRSWSVRRTGSGGERSYDPYDPNRDGRIDVGDVRYCRLRLTPLW